MPKLTRIALVLVFAVAAAPNGWAAEHATPQEVIAKVQEAAAFIEKSGAAGLAEFNDPKGRWVWADTYVWVQGCGKDDKSPTVLAHPIKPGLIGQDLAGLKDKNGTYFFIEFCEACKNPKGGWVEYWWPKPDEKEASRKISYILKVPGTDYEVGAGIYDDSLSVEELNRMVK